MQLVLKNGRFQQRLFVEVFYFAEEPTGKDEHKSIANMNVNLIGVEVSWRP
ncbi:MAG: hypothetical protein HUJ51_05100 [Eggerthellaceae bacterium]|nr:hypothetical protein [Eggerthellaceae bacterium]